MSASLSVALEPVEVALFLSEMVQGLAELSLRLAVLAPSW